VRACWDEGRERERERDVTEQNIYINMHIYRQTEMRTNTSVRYAEIERERHVFSCPLSGVYCVSITE
jgi:hypothetical protein